MPPPPRLRPRTAAPLGSEPAESRSFGALARDLSPWQRRKAARAQPRSPWKLRWSARPAASAAGRVRAVLKGRRQEPLIGCCLSGGGPVAPQGPGWGRVLRLCGFAVPGGGGGVAVPLRPHSFSRGSSHSDLSRDGGSESRVEGRVYCLGARRSF